MDAAALTPPALTGTGSGCGSCGKYEVDISKKAFF
jgi:hypothetical protein